MTQEQIDQIIKAVEWMLVDYEHLNVMGQPLAANWEDRVKVVKEAISTLQAAHARYAGEPEPVDDVDSMIADAQRAIKDGDTQRADMYLQAVRVHLSAHPVGYAGESEPVRQAIDALTEAKEIFEAQAGHIDPSLMDVAHRCFSAIAGLKTISPAPAVPENDS